MRAYACAHLCVTYTCIISTNDRIPDFWAIQEVKE
nr:MAG TPA: hypothetical protein [Microviridae sp.]